MDDTADVARTSAEMARERVRRAKALQPSAFQVTLLIPGHTLAEGLARGARGAYSNVACLSPAGAQRGYDLCRRDLQAGKELG